MTATARLHRAIHERRRHGSPPSALPAPEILDYDDSDHVVVAASTVLRAVLGWAPRTPAGRRALFLLVHWGYGSAVGIGHRALRAGLGGEPAAGAAFFVGCEAMALTLFPVLGDTPPPWRWRRDLLATSVVQHVVYAATVAAATRVLTPPSAAPSSPQPSPPSSPPSSPQATPESTQQATPESTSPSSPRATAPPTSPSTQEASRPSSRSARARGR